jgi:dUTPase
MQINVKDKYKHGLAACFINTSAGRDIHTTINSDYRVVVPVILMNLYDGAFVIRDDGRISENQKKEVINPYNLLQLTRGTATFNHTGKI